MQVTADDIVIHILFLTVIFNTFAAFLLVEVQVTAGREYISVITRTTCQVKKHLKFFKHLLHFGLDIDSIPTP